MVIQTERADAAGTQAAADATRQHRQKGWGGRGAGHNPVEVGVIREDMAALLIVLPSRRQAVKGIGVIDADMAVAALAAVLIPSTQYAAAVPAGRARQWSSRVARSATGRPEFGWGKGAAIAAELGLNQWTRKSKV